MKIYDAKNIPIQTIVEHLGGTFSHKGKAGEMWFYSPLRPTEKTASFRINEHTNKWYDFGHVAASHNIKTVAIGAGGDVIDLWCDCHFTDRREGVKAALKALEQFVYFVNSGMVYVRTNKTPDPSEPVQPRFQLLKLHEQIFYPQLKDELARRLIAKETAAPYLRQAFIQDTKNLTRKMNGFAWFNDKGGYEISIPNPKRGSNFKTAIAPKSITTIEGKDNTRAAIFESMWDFLTHLQMEKTFIPDCTTYILNSASLAFEAANATINRKDTIKTVTLFMQNDTAGINAMHQITAALEPHQFEIELKSFCIKITKT